MVTKTADHVGIEALIPRNAVICFDDYMGPGYSLPTPEMARAVRLLAETEGILLDPVYTGKAMAGLMGSFKKRLFQKNPEGTFCTYRRRPGPARLPGLPIRPLKSLIHTFWRNH